MDLSLYIYICKYICIHVYKQILSPRWRNSGSRASTYIYIYKDRYIDRYR